MPQHKSVKSLYDITLQLVELQVDVCCDDISLLGNYTSTEVQNQITTLKTYLGDHLPPNVLDDLCEQRKKNPTNRSRDIRIKLDVYMHSRMEKFVIDKTNSEYNLPVEDPFWIDCLSRLNKLVYLDLTLMCTDEILFVIGQCCPALEEINIVSRIETPKTDLTNSNMFDALATCKMTYYVSDSGLLHIANCKNLRHVTVNKLMRNRYGGRLVTEDGIRTLVKSLPKLEYINYSDLGTALSTDMEDVPPLSLTYLCDLHPEESHILNINRLCPNLNYLSLCMLNQRQAVEPPNCKEVLNAIAHSSLKLAKLSFNEFPFNQEMINMLERKGDNLTNIVFSFTHPINSNHLTILGRLCPNLTKLQCKTLGPEVPADSYSHISRFASDWLRVNPILKDTKLFPLLRHIDISGFLWNTSIIIPLCLSTSKDFKSIRLLNSRHKQCIDLHIMKSLQKESLQTLTEIELFRSCFISYQFLRYMFESCPMLKKITFPEKLVSDEDFRGLKDEIKNNNYDLKIYQTSNIDTESGFDMF